VQTIVVPHCGGHLRSQGFLSTHGDELLLKPRYDDSPTGGSIASLGAQKTQGNLLHNLLHDPDTGGELTDRSRSRSGTSVSTRSDPGHGTLGVLVLRVQAILCDVGSNPRGRQGAAAHFSTDRQPRTTVTLLGAASRLRCMK
jgi:hypothetical protein